MMISKILNNKQSVHYKSSNFISSENIENQNQNFYANFHQNKVNNESESPHYNNDISPLNVYSRE